jgi:hypothetical protein
MAGGAACFLMASAQLNQHPTEMYATETTKEIDTVNISH